MTAQNPNPPHDPNRKIRLKAIAGLYVKGQPIEPGEVFELEAREITKDMLGFRYEFVDHTDRPLVFRTGYAFL